MNPARVVEILKRARFYVEQEVLFMSDLTRHAPFPPDEQAKHDSTVHPCELLLPEIDALIADLEGNP